MYNPRLENPQKMEAALQSVQELAPEEDGVIEDLTHAVDEVLESSPTDGTTNTLGYISVRVSDAKREYSEENELRTTLSRVGNLAEKELGRFPAEGIERHYSLKKRRQNL